MVFINDMHITSLCYDLCKQIAIFFYLQTQSHVASNSTESGNVDISNQLQQLVCMNMNYSLLSISHTWSV